MEQPKVASLKEGDQVQWTHSRANGSSLQFTTRKGKVLQVNHGSALVKMRNGRSTMVPVRKLRPIGGKSELTEAFEAMAKGT